MRLFVAVDPPVPVREHLSAALAPLRERTGASRWAASDKWHVTVAFLSEVDPAYVDPLRGALDAVGARTPPLTLWLAGAGTFPERGRPHVLWAGLHGEVERLAELARQVRRAVRGLGLPMQRQPFRAHLTIGRWRPADRGDRGLVEPLAGYASPSWVSAELLLIHSTLGARATYETLHSAALSG